MAEKSGKGKKRLPDTGMSFDGPADPNELSEALDKQAQDQYKAIREGDGPSDANMHDILCCIRDFGEANPGLIDTEIETDTLYDFLNTKSKYAGFKRWTFNKTLEEIFGPETFTEFSGGAVKIKAERPVIVIADLPEETPVLRSSKYFRVAKVIRNYRHFINPDPLKRKAVRLELLGLISDVAHERDGDVARIIRPYLRIRGRNAALQMALKIASEVPRRVAGAKWFPVLKPSTPDDLEEELAGLKDRSLGEI